MILTTGGIDDLCLKYLLETGGARSRISRGLPRLLELLLSPVLLTLKERKVSRLAYWEKLQRLPRRESVMISSS